jgi:hypothetical protein
MGVATPDPVVDSPITVLTSWTRQGSLEVLTFNDNMTPGPFNSTFVFDSLSPGGDYVFTARVSPSNPTYVRATPNLNATFTINVQPYPDMIIRETIISGKCGVNETATLMGDVSLLPNIADNHNLTYTWTGPSGNISAFRDLTMNRGTLMVRNLATNTGNYTLNACLTIPGTNVVNHCSSTQYFISTAG